MIDFVRIGQLKFKVKTVAKSLSNMIYMINENAFKITFKDTFSILNKVML